MSENDDVFAKHLGKHQGMKIGEDTIYLKPLGIQHGPELISFQANMMNGMTQELMDKLEKEDSEIGIIEIKQILSGLGEEGRTAMFNLIKATLKKSFPEKWEKDRDALESFGLKYGLMLGMEIIKLNSVENHESKKKAKVLDKLNR